jgi:hypothetical protein
LPDVGHIRFESVKIPEIYPIRCLRKILSWKHCPAVVKRSERHVLPFNQRPAGGIKAGFLRALGYSQFGMQGKLPLIFFVGHKGHRGKGHKSSGSRF